MADRLRVALVGQGIAASLTPAMHEAEARAQGLDYTYEMIDTATPEHAHSTLGDIVAKAQKDGLAGLNITHPYKIDVLGLLDDLSDDARRLGAVNTVIFRAGRKIGHNTDYSGFGAAFAQEMAGVSQERVLLLGAGGAGAAVAFALIAAGVGRLAIHDLDPGRSRRLVDKLANRYTNLRIDAVETLDRRATIDLNGLVNATPMGMDKYPGSPIASELLHAGLWVSDIVYFPAETTLLVQARALGCRVMTGAAMAVWQAVHGFELFTAQRADPVRMHQSFARLSRLA